MAHVIVLWKMYSFALFYFEFEGNFRVQAPGGLYLEGRFIGGIFLCVCVTSLGDLRSLGHNYAVSMPYNGIKGHKRLPVRL